MILGIIGGLGPEAGCRFCLGVNEKFKRLTNRQPHLLLENLPISAEAEQRLILGGPSSEHLEMLKCSVARMNGSCDLIVIPCNTVHVFIDELRANSRVPIISIVEETANECSRRRFKRVGLLASTKTINEGLHHGVLAKRNIEVLVPGRDDQAFISDCIVRILKGETTDDDKERMLAISRRLGERGAEALILGCTDLPILISQTDMGLPVIDTAAVLEDAAVARLMR